MEKQPEITNATRNIFVEVFCDFYKVRPIEKITVKEIVQRAGYSRATFYNYFNDVYDLLEYVENEFISSIMEKITHNIDQRQSLEYFVHDFVEISKSKSMYINVFMNSLNNSDFVSKLKERILPFLLSSFGIQSDNLYSRYALEFYISGLVPIIGLWLKNGQDIATEDLALLIKGILRDGIFKQLQ